MSRWGVQRIMEGKTADLQTTPTANLSRYVPLIAILLGLLVVVGFVITRTTWLSGSPQAAGDLISAQTLADQYGIQVNLIAVTAAGGLVDLRLKVLDAEKASLLMQDSGDVPALLVGDGEVLLKAPADSTGQLLKNLIDDGNIFLTYPNIGNVVKPETLISVQFDEIHLEPIPAR